MGDQTREFVDVLMARAVKACEEEPLALLMEQYMKVLLAEALLGCGYHIREGAHSNDKDWILTRADGLTIATMAERPKRKKGTGSRDLRASKGAVQFSAEVKTYGEFGSRDHFERSGFLKDLGRVSSGLSTVSLVAVAEKLYNDSRGVKLTNVGRKPSPEHVLAEILPESGTIPLSGGSVDHRFEWKCAKLRIRAKRVKSPLPGNPARVIFVLTQDVAEGASLNP